MTEDHCSDSGDGGGGVVPQTTQFYFHKFPPYFSRKR